MTGLEMEFLELGPIRLTLPVPALTRLPDGSMRIDRCALGCDPQTCPAADHDAVRVWVVHAEVGL
jgi:hypothetical protein